MMKKSILLLMMLVGSFLLFGCGNYGEKDFLKDFTKRVEDAKGYHLSGVLKIINNEEAYIYDVDVAYKKEEQYRVSLKNQTNNHEQIILKNTDGVYVLTPSLNKSFKFQSEWPYNNSQSYLLQTLLKDIKEDKNRKFKEEKDGYVYTTKVTYSSNTNLKSQKIMFDKDLNVKKVEVYDRDGNVQIEMKFSQQDMKATYEDKYFTLKDNMAASVEVEETNEVSEIEDIIYPMYIPTNTHLTDEETVKKDDGERVILTFSGDKPFMFVQETASVSEDMLTIPVFGEPTILTDTVAAVSDGSVSWSSNGIDYYVVSDVMSEQELLDVARSVSVMPLGK